MAIAHNAKVFDLHFILNRAIRLKWKPERITNGLKIISMKMKHLVFLVSVSFLPCALRKLPEAVGLQASKSWYPTTLTLRKSSIMLGLFATYPMDEMGGREREEFLACYETRKSHSFHKKHVLEAYCEDDVTVPRQACRVFCREVSEIGISRFFLNS